MSVPSYTFKCSECDFSASGDLLIGPTVYDDGHNQFTCNYEAAWCNTCESITPLEVLKLNKHQLESAQLALDELSLNAHSPWSNFLNVIFKSKRKMLFREINEISDLLKYMELAKKRKGDEKCLKCGSHDATPFMGNKELAGMRTIDFTYSGKSPTGFIHPNCGGEIAAVGDDIRFSFAPSTNIYNMDGSFREKLYH
jgi:ferredoxin